MKEPIKGLIDRQGPPPREWADKIAGFVVKVPWSELQPTRDGLLRTEAIDKALALVTKPGPWFGMPIKLRVLAGIKSPEWVKERSGSIEWGNPKSATSSEDGGYVPRWWMKSFEQDYLNLHAQLAIRYDQVPEVRGVMFSGASTLYDEAMARQFNDGPFNIYRACMQGYTLEDDLWAILQMTSQQRVLWENTWCHIAIQPVEFTEMWTAFSWRAIASSLEGYRFQNHSLSASKLDNLDFTYLYEWMRANPEKCDLQTDSLNRMGSAEDIQRAMTFARELGVQSVELPQGYNRWSESMFGGWL